MFLRWSFYPCFFIWFSACSIQAFLIFSFYLWLRCLYFSLAKCESIHEWVFINVCWIYPYFLSCFNLAKKPALKTQKIWRFLFTSSTWQYLRKIWLLISYRSVCISPGASYLWIKFSFILKFICGLSLKSVIRPVSICRYFDRYIPRECTLLLMSN